MKTIKGIFVILLLSSVLAFANFMLNCNRIIFNPSEITFAQAAFAAAIAKANEAKALGDDWAALLAYINARDIYPMSSIANDEISKLAKQILNK